MRAPFRALVAVVAVLAACGPAPHTSDGGPSPDAGVDAGTPAPPVIQAPAAVDLGTFADGACPRGEADVCFENAGEAAAALEAVALAGDDAFALRALPVLPTTVAPGASLCVTVRFLGGLPGGAFVSTLSARFAGLETPVEVALSAEDTTDYRREDVFVQYTPPKADVLLVLDDAPLTSALRLEENLHRFADFWSRQELLIRMAVTTTALSDDGALLPLDAPAVLDVHDDGFLAAFDAVLAGRPVRADTPDQGLAAVLRTLDRNPDFARDGIPLAVIVVSAGDDADAATLAVGDFVAALLEVKGGPRHADLVSLDAAAGPLPDGCSLDDGTVVPPAPRYAAAASGLGGVFESACQAAWYRPFAMYSTRGPTYRTTFYLNAPPVPDSIEVRVEDPDGQVYETTWSYYASYNAVLFDFTSIPTAGSTIRVTYQLAYQQACPAP